MLSLEEMEAEFGGEKPLSAKEQLALAKQKELEEQNYNLRKQNLDAELERYQSYISDAKTSYDKLGRYIKFPLVSVDVRHQRGTFDLIGEIYDRRIRILEDTIKGRDLRSDLLCRIYLEAVEGVLKRHESSMNTLTQDFIWAKDKLMSERSAFLKRLDAKNKLARDEIKISNYASEMGEEIQKLIQTSEMDLLMFKEVYTKRFGDFSEDYEKRIMDQWIAYKNVFDDYKSKSKDLRLAVHIAKMGCEKDDEEIRCLKKKRAKLEAQFRASMNIINPGMVKDLNAERKNVEIMEKKVKEMQGVVKRTLTRDQKNLGLLNKVTDKVLKELKELRSLGEKVVRLRRVCSRLEMEGDEPPVESGEERTLNLSLPSARNLELQTAKVKSQEVYMEERLRREKKEEATLKKKTRIVIKELRGAEEKRELSTRLNGIECPPC